MISRLAVFTLAAASLAAQTPLYTYRVVKQYPHDRTAYTQGLQYVDGVLYEGTGLNGHSSLRKVQLETGKILQQSPLSEQYFGEGITVFGDRIIELTWTSQIGFVYERATFRPIQSFRYTGEGWGLTNDGHNLIMSDGTDAIRYLDPRTFNETGRIRVTDGNAPVRYLNELEWIKGEIWANVWQTDRIARISPITGKVTGWVDCRGLMSMAERLAGAEVLNGIAYDAKQDRIFITGKLWPKLFEVKVIPAPNSHGK